MHLGQRPRAWPDLVGDDLVVDLLAEAGEFGGGSTGHEGQCFLAAFGDVVATFSAGDSELDLLPREIHQIRGLEILSCSETTGEVDDRRTLHHGVVDVEECGGREVARNGRGLFAGFRFCGVGSFVQCQSCVSARLAGEIGSNFRLTRAQRILHMATSGENDPGKP